MQIPDYISLDTVRNAKYKLMTISESSGVHMHMLIMLHVKARNYLKHLLLYYIHFTRAREAWYRHTRAGDYRVSEGPRRPP